MNFSSTYESFQAETVPAPAYEAPAIESVLTPEDLEREVHYAGNVAVVSGAQPV